MCACIVINDLPWRDYCDCDSIPIRTARNSRQTLISMCICMHACVRARVCVCVCVCVCVWLSLEVMVYFKGAYQEILLVQNFADLPSSLSEEIFVLLNLCQSSNKTTPIVNDLTCEVLGWYIRRASYVCAATLSVKNCQKVNYKLQLMRIFVLWPQVYTGPVSLGDKCFFLTRW